MTFFAPLLEKLMILYIDAVYNAKYNYAMSITNKKADNLVKLLEGLAFLDNRDLEKVIGIVDALDFAKKRAVKAVHTETSSLDLKISSG